MREPSSVLSIMIAFTEKRDMLGAMIADSKRANFALDDELGVVGSSIMEIVNVVIRNLQPYLQGIKLTMARTNFSIMKVTTLLQQWTIIIIQIDLGIKLVIPTLVLRN